jgi:autotransporter passenger strand-loop-strand repeat protein
VTRAETPRRILQPADGRLRAQRRPALRTAPDRNLHQRIVPKIVVVDRGQTSNSVLVLSGGTLDILSGGTVSNVALSGGVVIVSHGGVASGTTVLAGGSQTDRGMTVAAVVDNGSETVSSCLQDSLTNNAAPVEGVSADHRLAVKGE